MRPAVLLACEKSIGPARFIKAATVFGLSAVQIVERAADAVPDEADRGRIRRSHGAAHHPAEARDHGVPIEVTILVLGHAPVEAEDVEPGGGERLGDARPRAKIEDVPAG